MKTLFFTSFEDLHEYYQTFEETDNEITVIKEDGWLRCDITTTCKRWRTVVNRFFKALGGEPALDGWQQCLTESFEGGCWKLSDRDPDKLGSLSWAYGLEAIDESRFYMWLTVRV